MGGTVESAGVGIILDVGTNDCSGESDFVSVDSSVCTALGNFHVVEKDAC